MSRRKIDLVIDWIEADVPVPEVTAPAVVEGVVVSA